MEMMKFVMARLVSQDQVKKSKSKKQKNKNFTKFFKTLKKISKFYFKIFLGDGGCVPDQNSINTGTHNTAFTVRLFLG